MIDLVPGPVGPGERRIERLLSLPEFWHGAIAARTELNEGGPSLLRLARIEAALREGTPLWSIPEYGEWRTRVR